MKKFLSIFLLFCAVFAFGQKFPSPSNPPKLVNDFAGVLSASEIRTLEQRLVDYDNQTTNQVTVVIVPTINGSEPTEYATELGRKWGIGNKENNGVLLLIAKDDRKLSIVPGYGLEGSLTDATCQYIIDNEIVPAFKAGSYYDGISNGADAIIKATQGTYKANDQYRNRGKSGKSSSWLTVLIIVIFIIIIFSSSKGGGSGGMMSRRGYRGINSPVWWIPTGGGGGGSSGGGGGGGFGGFGGGSFGGGGASGSW